MLYRIGIVAAAFVIGGTAGLASNLGGDDGVATEAVAETAVPPRTDPASTELPANTKAPESTVASTTPAETEAPTTFLPPEAEAVANGFGDTIYDLPACPIASRGAVTDKANQRYWLCMDGVAVTDEIPMTTASSNYGLPPVGTYEVFARDEDAFGIGGEALERFVAFYTTPTGNRIAFHEVVNQDPDTVGDLDQRGASAGCFRVREADSIQVWDFLQIGDPVVVLTN